MGGGSPPQNFFGPVTARSSKPSQGGALCHRQEPVARSARAEGGREGGGGRWVGGRWRGGRVRGRRGKGTFAVQLAALCEAGTVGPYREESESGAFSSLVPPPPLVSFPPHSVPSLSHFHINSSLPSFCGWSLEQQGHTFHTQHSLLIFIIPDEDRPSFVEHTHASRAQTHSSLDSSGARIVRLLRRIRGRSSRGNKGITCVLY